MGDYDYRQILSTNILIIKLLQTNVLEIHFLELPNDEGFLLYLVFIVNFGVLVKQIITLKYSSFIVIVIFCGFFHYLFKEEVISYIRTG